jgi:hypothetical protein
MWWSMMGFLMNLWCGFVGLVVAGGGYGWALLGLWWLKDIVGFSFCFFYVASNTIKYFSEHFPECNQTRKKKLFFLKSFTFANIL